MGGMKSSGVGRRHGAEGIRKYTDIQNVTVQHVQGFGVPKGMSQKQFAKVMTVGMRLMKRGGVA